MTFCKMGKMTDAIRDLSKVLELDPEHVNAAYARAACYNSKGQFSQAIEDYNLALTKDQVGLFFCVSLFCIKSSHQNIHILS